MKTSILSFYWVARAQDDPTRSAFHVDVLDEAETMDEVAEIGGLTRQRQMNVAQAQSEGFTLTAIAKAFNTSAASQVSALTEQLSQASTDAITAKAAFEEEKANMVAGHHAEREAQAAAYRAEVERMAGEHAAELQAIKAAASEAGEAETTDVGDPIPAET